MWQEVRGVGGGRWFEPEKYFLQLFVNFHRLFIFWSQYIPTLCIHTDPKMAMIKMSYILTILKAGSELARCAGSDRQFIFLLLPPRPATLPPSL